MPVLVVLLGITIDRAVASRLDLAVQDMMVNLALNVYPITHHRRTRTRIVRLLVRRAARTPSAG